MKTQLQLLTALALIIQVMVNGQTPGNQAQSRFKKSNVVVGASMSAYNKSLMSTATLQDAKNLMAKTESIQLTEKNIRSQAKTKKGQEKTNLIKSANELAKQIESLQIQASEIVGKLNLETFTFIEEVYSALIKDPNVNDNYIELSDKLNQEAEQTLKLSKEMRQEAYAMPTAAGKLGTMMNAEEKENEALAKQKQAIALLNKVSSVTFAIK